ncbi:PAS domain S-box protein [Nostoc sp. FACHB-152]|uniref:PAS domain S-box protein n=1 Tax=unclassified Nostoc TaxID=2593658 RepID=UPI0016845902|nr:MULTISPECIES: PAS domain S-box protein [unclassified Nostoc]MBD2447137.1 PAS domain S-box protein [Nostoc sp. FACHB-152]MBD2469185.1 PAS domain S-box protein [Nostoc sp. FACHB-145]
MRQRLANNQTLKIPLRLILTVPFVLLIGGTTGLVSYISLQNSQRSVNSLAYKLMSEISDRIHLYLSNYLKTPHLINRLNAQASELKNIDITNPQNLESYFLSQIQEFDSKRIHFINPQGGLVGAGNDERGLSISFTKNFRKGELYVYSVDNQGKRKKLLVNQQNYDGTQRPFYQKALLIGKPTWTSIFLYIPASRGLGIAASYPIYNQKQQLQGVFTSDIDLLTISEFLKKLQVGTHGQVFIMERSGLMVANSTSEQPFLTGANGTQNKRLKVIESKEPLISLAGKHLASRFGNLTQIKTAQQLYFDIEGKKQFLLIIPYGDQFGLDWLIVTVLPASDFTAEIDTNTRLTLIFSVAALVGAIALGLLLTQFIVRPMQQLGQTSLALANGEWNQAIGQNSIIAEFQVLQNSFHWMSQQLKQSYESVKTALEQSEERFTKVFRTCPEAMAILTLNGHCIDVNDAFIDLYGYSREEVIGDAGANLIYWASVGAKQYYLQDLLSGKTVRNQEFSIVHKSGKVITVLVSADIIELGGQAHIIAVTKDISNRKEAELELRRQKDLRESIYNESADALFLVDSQTLLISDCNHRAVELFEAGSKAELIGIPGHQLQVHQFTPEELSQITAQIEEKGVWSAETQYLTRKGNLFWGNLAAKEVAIANQVIHLVRVTDITDRKRVEAAILQSEAALRRAQQVAHVGSWELDIKTQKITWSEESFRIFGWSLSVPEPSIAQFFELIHPDDREGLRHNLEQTLTTQNPYKTEFRLIQPNGATRYVEARGEAVTDTQGQVIQLLGTNLDITERKEIEAALRHSEARFQQLGAASPAIIYTIEEYPGKPVRFEYLSQAFEEIQEIPVAEALKDPMVAFDCFHPEDRAGHQQAVIRALENMEPFKHEWRIITPSGKIKWVQAHSRPERCKDGTLLWHGVMSDISDRKNIEEALRHSEARFQKIAAVSPAQIYILVYLPDTNEMRYEYVSPGIREIQELEPEAVLEDVMLTYNQVHPDDLLLYNQLTTKSLKTLEPFAHEWRIITPSGKINWVRANSRPERRPNGEIAWYGVLLDITNLKQTELALRESEERFRHAFYDAPIGMALLGLDQQWLQINPMLREMLGYSELEFFNSTVFELLHPEDIHQLGQCIAQVLNNENRPVQVQLRYLCNDGRIAWGLTSLSLVRDFQNQPLYYVLQIQDVTEQQAIEQIKNEFISIVSHELRTPLTAIQGFLGLLNSGIYDNKPQKAKRMVEQALTNSDRLVRLVNDILDLERLSSGRVNLVQEVCNAADLMQRAVEGVQSIAIAAAIKISITPTTACVWADPDLIIQTLTNLLSNAIKFSEHDSVITLSAQPQSDWVLFAVKDQGRGIPADKLETIFERFGQVDISDARAKGGTGLGLAICQSIIQKHNGSIWAESTLGEGSTFYFTLPIPPGEL